MSEKKPFRRFKRREPSLSTEQKIEQFILRNSKNGYFTKVSTIPYKFDISESIAWGIVGELLSNGSLESIHDEISGEMKLCESGKTYSIMDSEKKRKRSKPKLIKKKPVNTKNNFKSKK
ncbi:MAG: hypothetical protein ACE5DU_01485 [Nitrosopumilus sp.]